MFDVGQVRRQQQQSFEGTWKRCHRTGCEVLIRNPAHPEFVKRLRVLDRKWRSENGYLGRRKDEPIPDEAREETTAQAVAEILLGGWRNVVEDKEGKQEPIPFSPVTAQKLLTEIVIFRLDVLDLVNSMSDEEQADREAVTGNSSRRSSMRTVGAP